MDRSDLRHRKFYSGVFRIRRFGRGGSGNVPKRRDESVSRAAGLGRDVLPRAKTGRETDLEPALVADCLLDVGDILSAGRDLSVSVYADADGCAAVRGDFRIGDRNRAAGQRGESWHDDLDCPCAGRLEFTAPLDRDRPRVVFGVLRTRRDRKHVRVPRTVALHRFRSVTQPVVIVRGFCVLAVRIRDRFDPAPPKNRLVQPQVVRTAFLVFDLRDRDAMGQFIAGRRSARIPAKCT